MDERPPGWYRDPDDGRQHRYWDGQEWSVTPAADGAPSAEVEAD
jgi:uncharacterized protein DUF2510